MSHDIESEIRSMLLARRGEWRHIAEQSGVVSYSWLSKYMCGHIPNPGIRTLTDLHSYLTSAVKSGTAA
jgi:transcriptional regulator with XRE-family HTH domain